MNGHDGVARARGDLEQARRLGPLSRAWQHVEFLLPPLGRRPVLLDVDDLKALALCAALADDDRFGAEGRRVRAIIARAKNP